MATRVLCSTLAGKSICLFMDAHTKQSFSQQDQLISVSLRECDRLIGYLNPYLKRYWEYKVLQTERTNVERAVRSAE